MGALESVCGKRNRQTNEPVIASDWHVDYILEICGKGEELVFEGKVQLFEEYWAPSVESVVKLLNMGTFTCPEGFGIMWHKQKGVYCLLYRPGFKQKALDLLEVDEPTLLNRARTRFSAERGEYMITLQKDEGTALGIDVELKDNRGLYVRTINEGLVSKWNESNPERQVDIGHVIAKVNGVNGSHEEILDAVKAGGQLHIVFWIPPAPKVPPRPPADLQARSATEAPAQASSGSGKVEAEAEDGVRIGFNEETERPSEVIHDFSVTLNKPLGTPLGLDVTPGSQNKSLVVKAIKPDGPAQTWNDANPSKELQVDDEIIQVNSAVGAVKNLIDECKKSEVLEMRVRRTSKECDEI